MSKKYTSLIRKIRKLSPHIQNRHRKDWKYLEKFDKIDGCGRNSWPRVQQSLSADGQHAWGALCFRTRPWHDYMYTIKSNQSLCKISLHYTVYFFWPNSSDSAWPCSLSSATTGLPRRYYRAMIDTDLMNGVSAGRMLQKLGSTFGKHASSTATEFRW